MSALSLIDMLAASGFLAAWIGYSYYADYFRSSERGLVGIGHLYRLQWAREMLARENRVTDASLIGNLITSVSFFASTTVFILAGIIAVLGSVESVMEVTKDLPFVRQSARELWEIKLLALLAIFVYAFFKFTWSIRQFNTLSILIGSAPRETDVGGSEEIARKVARVNSLAADEFHRGIRAYYFALAALTWFIQPWLFLVATALVIAVLYRQNFTSETLRAMRTGALPGKEPD